MSFSFPSHPWPRDVPYSLIDSITTNVLVRFLPSSTTFGRRSCRNSIGFRSCMRICFATLTWTPFFSRPAGEFIRKRESLRSSRGSLVIISQHGSVFPMSLRPSGRLVLMISMEPLSEIVAIVIGVSGNENSVCVAERGEGLRIAIPGLAREFE